MVGLEMVAGGDVRFVADVIAATAGQVTEFTVSLDAASGSGVVLRISDPTQVNGSPGPTGHPCNDWGVAYSSSWWLTT